MRPLAECGTPGAYRRHLRLGEPVDKACRRAEARYARERRRPELRRNRRKGPSAFVDVHVTLTEETAELVDDLARAAGIGRSEAIERLIILGLVEHTPVGLPNAAQLEKLYLDSIEA